MRECECVGVGVKSADGMLCDACRVVTLSTINRGVRLDGLRTDVVAWVHVRV